MSFTRTRGTFPDRKFFVETRKGNTGSISAVFRDGSVAELQDFFLVEDSEQNGVRHRLIDRALDYCSRRKVKVVYARIFPELKAFFESHGFNIKGRLRTSRNSELLLVERILGSED